MLMYLHQYSLGVTSMVRQLWASTLLIGVVALLPYPSTSKPGKHRHPKEEKKPPNGLPSIGGYGVPMCDSTGFCHENSTVPSPRTVFSARNKEQFQAWRNTHEVLVKHAQLYSQHLTVRDPTVSRDRPLVLIGDSITESYLGTSFGTVVARAQGVKETLEEFCGTHALLPLVVGISGDQTQHLLWRLEHGELPAGRLRELPGATFVVLIGTNNLGPKFVSVLHKRSYRTPS